MSETAPETTPARRPPAASQGGGFWSHKYGPLPAWGWAALAGGGALVYWFWKRKQSSTTAGSTTATAPSSAASAIGTLQSEIDQLQGDVSQLGTVASSIGSGSGGGGAGGSSASGTVVTSTATSGKSTGSTSGSGSPAALYWHAKLKEWTASGKKTTEPSGYYTIAGKRYYWHARPAKGKAPYFTLGKKVATPPSGVATKG